MDRKLPLEEWNLKELQTECLRLGLKKNGRKAELRTKIESELKRINDANKELKVAEGEGDVVQKDEAEEDDVEVEGDVPMEFKNVPIGKKPKRGRKPKILTGLVRQKL